MVRETGRIIIIMEKCKDPFLGNQYRLEIDRQEFFIDILLYRRLKCLVAVS